MNTDTCPNCGAPLSVEAPTHTKRGGVELVIERRSCTSEERKRNSNALVCQWSQVTTYAAPRKRRVG